MWEAAVRDETDLVIRALDAMFSRLAPVLGALDAAIGDGDHGANMQRGLHEVASRLPCRSARTGGDLIAAAGRVFINTTGGASGALFGSFLVALGRGVSGDCVTMARVAESFSQGVRAVKERGHAEPGDKTMLDVLVPVEQVLHQAVREKWSNDKVLRQVAAVARSSLRSTRGMLALKGRAAFLGSASVGHLDPGAASSALAIRRVCRFLEEA